MKGIILAIAVFLCTIAAYPQQPTFRQYSIPDGLTSNALYQVYQDSRGYIWAACSNGVSRFNGRHFLHVNDPLLRNEEFVEIIEGKNGKMWFVTVTGKTFVYNPKVKAAQPFVGNSQILRVADINKGHHKFSFIPLTDSSAIISFKNRGAYRIEKNKATALFRDSTAQILVDFSEKSSFVVSKSCAGCSMMHVRLKNGQIVKVPVNKKYLPTHLYATALRNEAYVVSVDNVVYVIDAKQKVHSYKYRNPVIKVFFDRDDRLFVSVYTEGVKVYSSADLSQNPIYEFLFGESISSILQDNEYGYWFSSLNSGLFYLPSLAFTRYTLANGLLSEKISRVLCEPGKLWIGYSDNFVSEMDLKKGKVVRNFMPKDQAITRPQGFLSDIVDHSVWIASNQLYKIKNEKLYNEEQRLLKQSGRERRDFWPREIRLSRDGGYWLAGIHGLCKIKGGSIVYDSYLENSFGEPLTSASEDLNGNVWLTSESVWLYRRGEFVDMAKLNPIFACRPTRVIFNNYDKCVWIASRINGVLMYDGKKVYSISQRNGLQSDNITAMDIDGKYIWLASSTGVDRITITQQSPFRYKITNFNSSHGIVPSNINGICASSDGVYFATTSGVMRFNENEYHENKTLPNVIIAMFDANGHSYPLDGRKIRLKPKENYVRVFFDACTYKNSQHPMFRYRLDGYNEGWIYTSENQIIFYPLSSGDYKLNISAMNSDGIWSDPKELSFLLPKPFYATLWFSTLILVVVVGIVYLVMRMRIHYIQKMNAMQMTTTLWKSQGLSLQMNPHFLFNTLNSIQLFILKYDIDASIEYLSKFASLMRKTLENSNKSSITIKEELESLELYLQLESLRCDHKFSYKILCDPTINESQTYIPTLLLQPFVENAIWHGIAPKGGRGKISVVLQDAGSYIKCRIVDNGIGRKKSQEIQKRTSHINHKSLGSKITATRMEMLRSLYSKNFELEYEDLYDAKGNPMGTEVLVVIPKDLKQLSSLLVN